MKIKAPKGMHAVPPSKAAIKMRDAILKDIITFFDEVDRPPEQDHLALTEVVNTLSMILAQVAYPVKPEVLLKFFGEIYRNHAEHISRHEINRNGQSDERERN